MSDTISDNQHNRDRILSLLSQLDESSIGRQGRITKLLSLLDQITREDDGIELVYSQIARILDANIFRGTSWEFVGKLEPKLVRGTLCAGFPGNIYEILSELRLLHSVESGNSEERNFASSFLEEAIISSFDLAFQDTNETSREEITRKEKQRIGNLFKFIMTHIPTDNLKHKLAEELLDISSQRPILTSRLEELIHLVRANFYTKESGEDNEVIKDFVLSLYGPTERTRSVEDPIEYDIWLEGSSEDILKAEAIQLSANMDTTGIVSIFHYLFIKRVVNKAVDLIPISLGLSPKGAAEFDEHIDLVLKIISNYIEEETRQALFSLKGVLNRNLFSRKPIRNAFNKLFNTDLNEAITLRLADGDAKRARRRLVAGVLGVLGQPMGIGQGNNPTCQSARGISMWSSHSPAKLLDMIYSVAAFNQLNFRYEGHLVKSKGLHMHDNYDFYLDPVSMILVPHLDYIYLKMMEMAQSKYPQKDPHVSVNPAFYGHWIQTGFISAYSHKLHAISDYSKFIRIFYASFHPEFNGNHYLVYPVPLGVYITNAHADLLGFHAISLIRVLKGPNGDWRAYFYNPNNEGRQNWGQDIKPSVRGNGEQPGESSLPFYQLLSRVYAFHFNSINIEEREQSVPDNMSELIEVIAKESWGRNYSWQ